MPSSIEQLAALQQVDTQLRALRLELSALGGAAAELKTTVGTKRSVTQAKRQEMQELEKQWGVQFKPDDKQVGYIEEAHAIEAKAKAASQPAAP